MVCLDNVFVLVNIVKIVVFAVYKCGSNLGWSEEFTFRTFPSENDTTWVPKICIYGDLGIENGRSILSLLGFAENKLFDMIIHIGK